MKKIQNNENSENFKYLGFFSLIHFSMESASSKIA